MYSNTIGAAASGVPLPLGLLYFNATVQGSTILLNRETDKEYVFVVERSATDLDWIPIGSAVSAASGDYSYTDHQPLAGDNFYRVRIKSAEDHYIYSTVRRIQSGAVLLVQIYPNSRSGRVYIRMGIPNTVTRLALAGIDGCILNNDLPLTLPLSVDMSPYSSGLYFLTVSQAEGTHTILKLRKM